MKQIQCRTHSAKEAPLGLACRLAGWRSGAVLVTLSDLYGYGPASRSLGVSACDQSPIR